MRASLLLRTGLLAAIVLAAMVSLARSPAARAAMPPINTDYDAVSAGRFHACAIQSSALLCWGSNGGGQVGNNSVQDTFAPAPVPGLASEVTAVSTGAQHTCAIKNHGVSCWGSAILGQTGNASDDHCLEAAICRLTPEPVILAEPSTDIATGSDHSCAVAGGSAWCWGSNNNLQLGVTTTTGDCGSIPCAQDPVQVPSMSTGVTDVTAGAAHTCAIKDGGAWCWGRGTSGQLGNNSTASTAPPVQVTGLTSGVTQIAAGGTHTCAIQNGAAFCWGSNSLGQLGNGTTTNSSVPVAVTGFGSGVSMIDAGGNHTCAIKDGSAYCWGFNVFGTLGNGTNTNALTPSAVSIDAGVSSIDAGDFHSCAILNGALSCWGDGFQGQLGNNVAENTVVPTDVISGVRAISAGGQHACALEHARVSCWGENGAGQLGHGSTDDSSFPVLVEGLGSGVGLVAAGGAHTCAVKDDGVWCWGENGSGQLGDGTTDDSLVPVQVADIGSGVAAISAGNAHTCALVFDTVMCWGDNSQGQLGNIASVAQSSVPLFVDLPDDVIGVEAGAAHTCANATIDLKLWCWGDNEFGQLGNNSTADAFAPVAAMYTEGSILTSTAGGGGSHTCTTDTQNLWCWGRNLNGQLGDGTTDDRHQPLLPLAGVGPDILQVSAGASHTCRIQAFAATCWGLNSSGQLGNGSTTQSLVPVAVTGHGTGVHAISAGDAHTCAIKSGVVSCWGANASGQLGNHTFSGSTSPVALAWDSDGDGCTDSEEAGDEETFGGNRDARDFWDFFDVNHNRAIDLGDTLDILVRFGLTPEDTQYDARYDRVIGPPAEPWRNAAATGDALGIDLSDALANLQSFGHSCADPP